MMPTRTLARPRPPKSYGPPVRFAGALLLLFLGSDPLFAAFLDEAVPARSAALGGHAAASPEGIAALVDNPAGLGWCESYQAAARYQRLMGSLGVDDLGTGSLACLGPAGSWGGWGISWDHFGADRLQRDRIRLAGSRALPYQGRPRSLALGFSLSFLSQRYTLTEPLSGVSPEHLSASSLSFGVGALWKPHPRLTLGLSGEDLTRPNLGVVDTDRFEPSLRAAAAYALPLRHAGRLTLHLGAERTNRKMEPGAGAEWSLPAQGLALRAGGGPHEGAVGFGFSRGGLLVDYAFVFSVGSAASLDGTGLPVNHLVEVGWRWGGRFLPEDPDGAAAWIRRASEASSKERWNEALWSYKRALEKAPEDPAAQSGWAKTLESYNHDRAERYLTFGRQAELRGLNVEARQNYEWALQLEPSHAEARASLERVRALSPTGALADARVVRTLQEAAGLSARGEHARAAELLETVRAQYPDDAALRDLTKALTTAPVTQTVIKEEDPAVERLLAEAEIYQHKGRGDLAADSWKRILAVDPQNAAASAKLQEARSPQTPDKTVSPAQRQRAQALYEKGLKAYLEGDIREAIQAWEGALAEDPRHENALNNLARARLEVSREGFETRPSKDPGPTPQSGGRP